MASPVAEVGRDHDYDWAIIEPSSMRSIIQIAGRVLRHRETKPQCKNILLLDKNIKCLNSNEICFEKPGFEIKKNDLYLKKHDLESTLHEEEYQKISSIQRIIEPDNYKEKAKLNLVALEHKSLLETLFASESAAKLWWKKKPYWSGEIQKQQKFRDSKKDEAFYLILEGGEPKWLWKNEKVYPAKWGEISGAGFNITHREDVCFSNRVGFWFDLSAENIYEKLADDFKKDIKDVGRLFGEVRLVNYKERDIGSFLYSQNLGLYQEVVLCEPRVISPLKVVPKKGNTYRLILDLSKMNKHLRFPRFKYAHINQTRDVFEPGDFLFAWDLKDGYWHIDLHPEFWTHMAFEWEGVTYYFAVLPFGCAPACWVFTTVIDVLIATLNQWLV